MRVTWGCAAGVVVLGLTAGGGMAQTMPAATCSSAQLVRFIPSDAQVELLMAAGPAIPAGAWPEYRALARTVLECLAPGDHLVLRPITATSIASPPVFVGQTPGGADSANPLLPRIEQRKFIEGAMKALATLPHYPTPDPTYDPAGALIAAGAELALTPPATRRLVFAIWGGWLQSRDMNLFVWGGNPLQEAAAVIARLRALGAMPQLEGSLVFIAGIRPGVASMRVGDVQLAELCSFWREMVQAFGGQLVSCGASLPGVAIAPTSVR